MQKCSRGYTNFLKCFHNEISTLKCYSHSYISKYSAHDYSQGIIESQCIAQREHHLKRLRTTSIVYATQFLVFSRLLLFFRSIFFSVGCCFSFGAFSGVFSGCLGFQSIAGYIRNHIQFSSFFLSVGSRPPTMNSGPFHLSFSPGSNLQ